MVESSPMGSARASPFTNRNISGQFSPIACPQSDLWATGPQDHPQFCLVLALLCMVRFALRNSDGETFKWKFSR
ncbi:hypothetical protein LWI29_007444 [Acer saccharum]|uniref:Uncharacterized protein n=1 Tax=Acer saccharum TaxID=4024 RepID=A0AA39RUA2_ACESA|nr:hypothetical protein LWI29_007444 [Acer saccharum]